MQKIPYGNLAHAQNILFVALVVHAAKKERKMQCLCYCSICITLLLDMLDIDKNSHMERFSMVARRIGMLDDSFIYSYIKEDNKYACH